MTTAPDLEGLASALVPKAANDAGELLSEKPANPRKDAWRLFRKNKAAVVGLVWAVSLTFVAIFAPWIQRYDPKKIDPANSLTGPSAKHWLGSDLLGRDVFSRLVNGARISLTVALGVATFSILLGLLIGAVAGFRGGVIDAALMRIADIFLAVPYIVVILAAISALGRSEATLILATVAISWMGTARLFRGSVLQVKSLDFIEAARASGSSTTRILRKHVFANAIQPVIVSVGFAIGGAVLLESVFAFLGIGLAPGTPSWGVMVGESREYITDHAHLFFFPAGCLILTVLAFAFIGDGVRDALDPKMRGF